MTDQLREKFEAWYVEHMKSEIGSEMNEAQLADMRDGDTYGDRGYLNGAWYGYRAARASAPAASPGPADERAMFEAWQKRKAYLEDGEWNAWQARAAIDAARSVAQGDQP